jgi:hypothetical protein
MMKLIRLMALGREEVDGEGAYGNFLFGGGLGVGKEREAGGRTYAFFFVDFTVLCAGL